MYFFQNEVVSFSKWWRVNWNLLLYVSRKYLKIVWMFISFQSDFSFIFISSLIRLFLILETLYIKSNYILKKLQKVLVVKIKLNKLLSTKLNDDRTFLLVPKFAEIM